MSNKVKPYVLRDSWTVEDVRSIFPHFTVEQCNEVLLHIEIHFDASIGINWDVIQNAGEVLFPPKIYQDAWVYNSNEVFVDPNGNLSQQEVLVNAINHLHKEGSYIEPALFRYIGELESRSEGSIKEVITKCNQGHYRLENEKGIYDPCRKCDRVMKEVFETVEVHYV